jgi:hypothetical protein
MPISSGVSDQVALSSLDLDLQGKAGHAPITWIRGVYINWSQEGNVSYPRILWGGMIRES